MSGKGKPQSWNGQLAMPSSSSFISNQLPQNPLTSSQNIHLPISTPTKQNTFKGESIECSMPSSTIIILSFLTAAAAFIASASATVTHTIPHELLRKREPQFFARLHPPPPSDIFVPLFNFEQQEFLKAHNDLRGAANTPPLLWSPQLTQEAHEWAVARSADCNYRLHSPSSNGENIFYMQYKEFTPTEIVQRWFDESRFYDHTNNVCRCNPEVEGCECGHYLTAVWSTTKFVGCSGAVYCDDQKGVIVVCQYDPPGLDPNVNPFTGEPLPSIKS